MKLIVLAAILFAPLVWASDTIVTPQGSGNAFVKTNAGDQWPASVVYTTDGNGHVLTLGGVLLASDNIYIPKGSGNAWLTDNVGRFFPASIVYTTDGNGNVVPITAGSGGGTWGSITGTLSSQTDLQAALNAKQNTLTIGSLTAAGTDGITVTGGSNSVLGSGASLSQHVADATHNGYLSSGDWVAFNGKQAAGSYLTVGNNLSDVGTPATAFNNISGFTALGDTHYGGSSGVRSVLPGNTTTTKKYLSQTGNGSVSAAPSWAQVAFSDLSGSVAASQLPNPSTSTLGGIRAIGATSHQWINSISTSGIPQISQPAFTDLTGSATIPQTTIGTQALGGTAIDWSTGSLFTKSIGSTATTFTWSNQTSGQTITVRITATTGTVTWPSVKWPSGTAPTQTPNSTDVCTFVYDGTSTYGSCVQDMH